MRVKIALTMIFMTMIVPIGTSVDGERMVIEKEDIAAVQEAHEEVELDQEEIERQEELELMAHCVQAEAGNQGLMGKRMVACVILNRVDSQTFPNTIREVITQPHQFTTYWNGAMEINIPDEETYLACQLELESRSYPEIMYFTAGRYGNYGTPWGVYGNHYFSTE